MNEDERLLVLARLKTLKPEGKVRMGDGREISVGDMITAVEKNDEFGKKIVKAQMSMLRVLGHV